MQSNGCHAKLRSVRSVKSVFCQILKNVRQMGMERVKGELDC